VLLAVTIKSILIVLKQIGLYDEKTKFMLIKIILLKRYLSNDNLELNY